MSEIGKFIDKKLKELDMTQGELAQRSGVSAEYISKIVSGKRKNPSESILRKLAKPLHLPADRLLEVAGIIKPRAKEKTEDEVLAEALHVDPDVWESLTEEEKEFILRDAREKAEFFTKRKGH